MRVARGVVFFLNRLEKRVVGVFIESREERRFRGRVEESVRVVFYVFIGKRWSSRRRWRFFSIYEVVGF